MHSKAVDHLNHCVAVLLAEGIKEAALCNHQITALRVLQRHSLIKARCNEERSDVEVCCLQTGARVRVKSVRLLNF